MIILTDIQEHDFKDFAENLDGEMTTRLMEFVDSLRFVGKYMLDTQDKNLVFLGDMFEVKGYVKVLVYNIVYKEFVRLTDQGIKLWMLTGNHDQYDQGGLIHSLVPFKSIAKVYDTLKVDQIDGITCVFIPYRKDKKQFYEDLAKVEKMSLPPDSILFLHQILEGAKINDSFYASRAGLVIPESVRTKFKYIFCGDVHTKQRFSNIVYPGSLFSRDFKDAFETKGFIRYLDGEILDINNPHSPLFLKYRIENLSDIDTIKLEHTAKIYLDIEAKKEFKDVLEKKLDSLEHVKYRIRLIKDAPAEIRRTDIKLVMPTEEVLCHYVEHAGNNDQALKDLGISIYKEALKKE